MSDYGALLRELAVPRLVGSPNHARVRAALKRELAARGFVVMEQQFPAAPDELQAVALGGAALAWGALAAVPLALLPGSGVPLAGWVIALELGLLLLFWSAARGIGMRLTAHSTTGVNLVAVRPRARVSLWLTAHYDSKGQPISMATRLVAVFLSALGCVALLACAALRLRGGMAWHPAWALLAAPALLGGFILSRSRITDDSPGAVDNASALVTVLAGVDALPSDAAVGVVFPDAEEYGLLGAKALVRERANLFEGTAVLNFDGIDDRGGAIAFAHRPGPTVEAVVKSLGARRARWLPVVVDGLVFARVARECVTLMRGDWGTARIVHTPADTADRLTLGGSRTVAAAVARALGQSAEPRIPS